MPFLVDAFAWFSAISFPPPSHPIFSSQGSPDKHQGFSGVQWDEKQPWHELSSCLRSGFQLLVCLLSDAKCSNCYMTSCNVWISFTIKLNACKQFTKRTNLRVEFLMYIFRTLVHNCCSVEFFVISIGEKSMPFIAVIQPLQMKNVLKGENLRAWHEQETGTKIFIHLVEK